MFILETKYERNIWSDSMKGVVIILSSISVNRRESKHENDKILIGDFATKIQSKKKIEEMLGWEKLNL